MPWVDSVTTVSDARRPARAGDARLSESSPSLRLVLARRGAFVVRRGNRRQLVTPGHLLLLRPGEEYAVSHPGPLGDETTTFDFAPTVLATTGELLLPPSLWRELDAPSACVMAPPALLLFCHRLRHQVRCGVLDAQEAEAASLAVLTRAVAAIRAARGARPRAVRSETEASRRVLADRVRIVLAANPERPHALAGVAREVASSPYHLTRIFRDAVGMPVHQYLLQLRLALALERIADGNLPLSHVALDLGFATHSHLTVRFQRAFGLSPAEFRRSLRSPLATPVPEVSEMDGSTTRLRSIA